MFVAGRGAGLGVTADAGGSDNMCLIQCWRLTPAHHVIVCFVELQHLVGWLCVCSVLTAPSSYVNFINGFVAGPLHMVLAGLAQPVVSS